MFTIFCLGELKSEHVSYLTFDGFAVSNSDDVKSFINILRLSKPAFCFVEDSYFERYINESGNICPCIVFTYKPLGIEGYHLIRMGALDYISLETDDITQIVQMRLKKPERRNTDFLGRVIDESNQLYFSIVENAPIISMVVNTEGNLLIYNSEARKVLDIKEGKEDFRLYLDPVLSSDFISALTQASRSDRVYDFKCAIVQGEKMLPVQWYFTGFNEIISDSVLVFGKDINEAMEMRKKEFFQSKSLLALNEKLERTNKSLDQFSRMISHDIKNGLSRILGFTRILMQKEKEKFDPESLEISSRIIQNTEDMSKMVNRILDFAKSKGSNLLIKKFFIDDLLKKILGGFDQQFSDIGGQYEISKEHIEIEADLICLKQIFENLISNAIKYRSPDRPLLFQVNVVDMGADLLIVLSDNGIGIKPGDEEKLFEEYYREESVAKKIEGHGIGLSTVKTLLDSHGGVIWVEPDVAVGSVFNIQLPKAQ